MKEAPPASAGTKVSMSSTRTGCIRLARVASVERFRCCVDLVWQGQAIDGSRDARVGGERVWVGLWLDGGMTRVFVSIVGRIEREGA
jgi:hypothetical protein